MPINAATARMVRASGPSCSRIERAAPTTSDARAERTTATGGGLGSAGMQDEHGVPGGDRQEGFVGRVGAHPAEEHADLRLPATQVGPEHLDLLLVGQLRGDVGLTATAEEQLE